MKWIQIPIGITLLLLFACQNNTESSSEKSPESNTHYDLLSSHIDSSIHPGDDFFGYANGGWLKKNEIPAEENGWGIFNLVSDENYTRLLKISEEATTRHASEGTPDQQIGDFFFSGMDSTKINTAKLSPIKHYLDDVNNASDVKSLLNIAHELHLVGINTFFDFSVYQDLKNSDRYVLYISQGGLGLPDRDYYFQSDKHSTDARTHYLQYIQAIMEVSGKTSTEAPKCATDVLLLETEMAKAHKTLSQLRDPYANYSPTATKELNKLFPQLQLSHLLSSCQVATDTIIIGQTAYMHRINTLCKTIPIQQLKNYINFHIISEMAPYLHDSLYELHFNFYSRTLRGTKMPRPRWKRVLDAQEDALGDALGQLFVKEYFPEKTKKRYEDLVERIIESYATRIQQIDWMTDSTKSKALVKLKSIRKKVGYPNRWKDYSSMRITRESFATNVLESRLWQFNYQMDKLNKTVDRDEWMMTPQTYNAYYNPSNNEIVLPAAIFTAPGYQDEELDDAIVYGYVGASTIGHELTHGFDDEGRQFDEKGNLHNWWSKQDEEQFKLRTKKLVEQFNQYIVLDSLHPNGEATLGENIADLGGIVIGLDAFKKTKQYQEGKSIGGLTPLQRYFMGYAYGWMQTKRPEALANQLLTDVHAPIFLRVNGPMSNCDEWYEAFGVTPQHKLYRNPDQRVKIW